ncbi:MAG: YjjG family noncanonical pyrimidine nucleotidase, partial [Rikenellaceae bacterium]|nr:YjjG family noncanonical pyrimidine nucleotidase [Rikenellaceae bacterium]
DDTVWDVRSTQEAAQRERFATFGMEDRYPDFHTYYNTFREINQKLWTEYRDGIVTRETLRNQRFVRLLESAGIRDERLAMDMSNEYLRISPTFNALMPHSLEVLEYLHGKGYPMSLITNGFNEVQFHKVEYSGLKKFFQRITTSEFAGIGKPNPGIFEYAMRKAEVTPSECIMVGDDVYTDIYGSSTVGMPSVFVNPSGAEHDQHPLHEVRSLRELTEIF